MAATLLLVVLGLPLALGEWTQLADAGWSPRSAFQMAVSDNDVIVAGGTDGGFFNDAYRLSLSDGSWYPLADSSPQWPPRANFGMTTLSNGTLVLTGGQKQDGGTPSLKDVWARDIGGKWRQLPDAPWPHRVGHTQVTCKGPVGSADRVIIAGGVSNNAGFFQTIYNDVWSMAPDGSWTQLPDAPWHKRFLHASACLSDGSMVLTGGHHGFSNFNDVWLMSPTGTWKELPRAPFSKRARFTIVAFPDDSVLVGQGMGDQDLWIADDVRAGSWRSLGQAPFSARYDSGMVALPKNGTSAKRSALIAGGMLLDNGIHNYNNVYRLVIDDAAPLQVVV